MASSNTPVIFLAFANDREDGVRYLRNLPEEARRLRDELEPAVNAGLCEVVERMNATTEDIFRVFQSAEYRDRVSVFHYGGHANGYSLLLESAQGAPAAADAGGLARFLGEQNELQLVFLNGCSTQRQSQGLLDAGIPTVIATSTAIDDGVATDFSSRLYRGIASGANIETAFNEATAAAQTEKSGDTRAFYFVDEETQQPESTTSRWPWDLYVAPGAQSATAWNLPESVNNPLFGLPELPALDLPPTPYRHLNWFRREDAELFFGRGSEIRDLYQKITAPKAAPVVLYYGQSGVGKSSLLSAGLLPRMESSHEVRYLRRQELDAVTGTLDLAFLPEAVDQSPPQAWLTKEAELGKPLVVVMDQLEEIFTRPNGDPLTELTDFLKTTRDIFTDMESRPQGKLILAFRKEWLAEIEDKLLEFRIPHTKVFLDRLDREGVIEVVRGPASRSRLQNQYHLQIDDDVAAIIADDLLSDSETPVAPTLQILLTRMWTAATLRDGANPRFDRELYEAMQREGILL